MRYWLFKKIILVFLLPIFTISLYNIKIVYEGFYHYDESSLHEDELVIRNSSEINETKPMKYILQWTSHKNVPFVFMGQGQSGFIDRKCPHTNCFVTPDRNYLGDITKFDVIAFSNPEVSALRSNRLPNRRSPHQKYVFATIESSDNYPVCSNRFDGYFNWTWTFRLDSEVRWGYFNIWDKKGNIVGPNKIMHWIKAEDMDPVSDEFKEQLKSKTLAAAWFVSNCRSRSQRGKFVKDLQVELINNYNLTLDVFGKCGSKQCPRDNEGLCFDMVKEKYYFYLSFENSFAEDYVTEKLLTAVQNDAIPIVYGGANYTRFLPPGMYLDARELGIKALAAKMDNLIKNPEEYANYFKWKNHYTYLGKYMSVLTNEYCLFCTILNDEQKVKETSIYQNFRTWWDPPGRC